MAKDKRTGKLRKGGKRAKVLGLGDWFNRVSDLEDETYKVEQLDNLSLNGSSSSSDTKFPKSTVKWWLARLTKAAPANLNSHGAGRRRGALAYMMAS
ncbi:hypothetical protein QQX98_007443 [Neonectria punicea]|uniref:Uncharacterized protein n=1 Tax=Neonectria punicea TaxID=979145 RepID=A0ABR1GXX3_9HYPO